MLELSSKFGTTPDDAARLLKRVAEAGAAPAITFHVGSQCLSPFSPMRRPSRWRAATAGMANIEITSLDIGGGFPGPYMGNDVPPYHWYFDTIREAMATHAERHTELNLLCEPGRALIAEGVSLVTQVVLRKGDKLYINIDGIYGSFDELNFLCPAGSPTITCASSALDAKRPRAFIAAARTDAPFRVYGPTCDTLDVLPRPLMLPESIGPGDYIVFDAMQAPIPSACAHDLQRLLSRTAGRSWATELRIVPQKR